MAEGRKDRSGRRRRKSGQQYKASSDSELGDRGYQGGGGGGAGGDRGRYPSEEDSRRKKCFFHEGLDVDQLARYRRRRVAGQPRDHLGAKRYPDNEDDEEDEEEKERRSKKNERLLTEYRLAFRSSSDDIFRANEEISSPVRTKRHIDDRSTDQRKTEEISIADTRASYNFSLNNFKNDKHDINANDTIAYKTQTKIDYGKIMEMGSDFIKRPAPIRRPTTLRNEGEFSSATEYSSYVPHPGLHRSELQRRGTSLKMEGEFESSTEKNDKFVEWPADSRRRPEILRMPSQLRLEGELETSTECHDNYVPFVGARRPEILRQSAQLKFEGDANWVPEYTDVFREFDYVERPTPKKHQSHLKPDGGFYGKSEMKQLFTNPREKEIEFMTELAKETEEEEEKKRKEEEEEEEKKRKEAEERNRLKEEEMKILVSKLEDLKGTSTGIPEYKDAYKDFPRERPKLAKPEDEIGRADGSKVSTSSPSHGRFKTKIDQDPEYKSIYLDSSRDRPVYHRPPPSLRPSAASSSRSSLLRESNDYRRDSRRPGDQQHPLSEIRSQYVGYGHVPRVETLRIPANLRLEGNVDTEPEYQSAYCSNQDYRGNSHTRRDRSPSISRKRDNYWIDNNNGEQFGTINAANEQDAFQVLQTRVHEESVVGKPPPGSRRNSRSSLLRSSMQPDFVTSDRSSQHLRHRSPSPSYRLQVSHVDEEPRGFVRRRRSPSQNLLVHASSNRSPSPIQRTVERPYSPSFARENSAANARQQQAFVVLDGRDGDDAAPRRRKTDRNYNPGDSLTGIRSRPRNKSPPNWMPPWYDSSTSTI